MPAVLLLEVLASTFLIAGVWHKVNWLPMGIGLAAGKRSFLQTDQTAFGKKAMLYLILLAGLLLAKTVWDVYRF